MKAKGEWLTQALFEAGGRVDDYIQEPVETGGFILWKNIQRAEKKNSEEGLEKHADLCLFWSRGRKKTAMYSKKHVA